MFLSNRSNRFKLAMLAGVLAPAPASRSPTATSSRRPSTPTPYPSSARSGSTATPSKGKERCARGSLAHRHLGLQPELRPLPRPGGDLGRHRARPAQLDSDCTDLASASQKEMYHAEISEYFVGTVHQGPHARRPRLHAALRGHAVARRRSGRSRPT